MKKLAWTLLLCLAIPGALAAQLTPQTPEFQVNETTTDLSPNPRVAVAADGSFLAVWAGEGMVGGGAPILVRRFDASGMPTGSETQVNQSSSVNQFLNAVAALTDGRYIVIWTGLDGDGAGVIGRFVDGTGAPVGAEFLLNGVTAGSQLGGDVTALPAGAFAATWTSLLSSGAREVWARVFDGAGLPAGGEVVASGASALRRSWPRVSSNPTGEFVVTYGEYPAPAISGETEGFLRRFSATGQPMDVPTRFTEDTTAVAQLGSPVGFLRNDTFLVTWTGTGDTTEPGGVWARRYSMDGTFASAPYRIDTIPGRVPTQQTLAQLDTGLVVAWQSLIDVGSFTFEDQGPHAVLLDSSGQLRGEEFLLLEGPSLPRSTPHLDSDNVRHVVGIWGGSELFRAPALARLYRSEVLPAPAEIPALSPKGMAVTVGLLLIAGLLLMRRRRGAPS